MPQHRGRRPFPEYGNSFRAGLAKKMIHNASVPAFLSRKQE
jgi:hypothetical protein